MRVRVEFRHRLQAIVEGFSHLWKDIESEKRWFATKWARQEKEIRKIIDSTQGMYGDLQAVTGRSLTAIPALEVLTDLRAGGSGEAFSSRDPSHWRCILYSTRHVQSECPRRRTGPLKRDRLGIAVSQAAKICKPRYTGQP
jgi:hypothetical protein